MYISELPYKAAPIVPSLALKAQILYVYPLYPLCEEQIRTLAVINEILAHYSSKRQLILPDDSMGEGISAYIVPTRVQAKLRGKKSGYYTLCILFRKSENEREERMGSIHYDVAGGDNEPYLIFYRGGYRGILKKTSPLEE